MSKIEGKATCDLNAIQNLAVGYVDGRAVGLARQTELRSNPRQTSDIEAEAEPFVRLKLDSTSVVGLEVLIVPELREAGVGRQRIGKLIRILTKHVDRGAGA